MTVAVALRPPRRARTLTINIAATLAFGAIAALVFNELVGTLAALAFLLCTAALFLSNFRHSLSALARWWPLLLLPGYCVASVLWSSYPDLTLRLSLQLSATVAMAVLLASRLDVRALLRCLFAAYAMGTLVSVLVETRAHGPWQGMFDSKNAFAAHLGFFVICALALALDTSASRGLRFFALAAMAASAPLLVLAQSTGVLLTIVPCMLAMVLVAASGHLSGPQKLFTIVLVALAMAGTVLFIVVNQESVLAGILEATGKDATLTGRTDLWGVGLARIADNPLLGTGYRAFWVPGNGPAEQLWAQFGVQSGAGFNFHNTYISNAVDLGLVGLSLQLSIIYGALFMLVLLAIVRPSSSVAFLLGAQLLLVMRSFIEVEVFFEFSLRSILAICSFIYAARELGEWRRVRRRPAHPVLQPRRRRDEAAPEPAADAGEEAVP